MFTLTAERPDGQRLTLTEYGSAYNVKYSGLGPVNADVITSSLGMVDGAKINSARVDSRNIVLTVYISGSSVEAKRLHLYGFFTPKQAVKLYYKNGARDVYTEGIVETCEIDQFSAIQRAQISIICPQPYLIGAAEIFQDITGVRSLFTFPFAIAAAGIEFSRLTAQDYAILQNDGDVSAGFVASIFAVENVVNPVIYNAITGEAFRVSGTLEAGYTLTIGTITGAKKLTITSPSGQVQNALYRKKSGSVWLQLAPGSNYISYAADSGEDTMLVTLRHNNLFVGV